MKYIFQEKINEQTKIKFKRWKKDGIMTCLAVSNTALKVRYCKIH